MKKLFVVVALVMVGFAFNAQAKRIIPDTVLDAFRPCLFCDVQVCGNGIQERGEVCDDGNLIDRDACRSDCSSGAPLKCGNGIFEIETSEQCDDGNLVNDDGCDNECHFPYCGNGMVDRVQEECDDHNRLSGDGCSSRCQIEEDLTDKDGDGIENSVDECPSQSAPDTANGCPANANNESVCGNTVMEGSEQCDDGNVLGSDGCSSVCVLEEIDNNNNDVDGDSVVDSQDNCVLAPNQDQVDTDDDGSGDACDPPLVLDTSNSESDDLQNDEDVVGTNRAVGTAGCSLIY